MQQENQPKRAPLEYKEEKVFSDSSTKLAVRLMKAQPERGLPQFRLEHGEIGNENQFYRGHRLYREVNCGVVLLKEVNFQVLEALQKSAMEYARQTLQDQVDAETANRKPREGEPRPGLKTLAKMDKAKREANVR